MGGQNEIILDLSNINSVPNTDKIWNLSRVRVGRKIFLASFLLWCENRVHILELCFGFADNHVLYMMCKTHKQCEWKLTHPTGQLLTPCKLVVMVSVIGRASDQYQREGSRLSLQVWPDLLL